MIDNPKLYETLKKKAYGFTYTEETMEYELLRSKPIIYCEKYGRIYFKNGYLKVKKVNGGVSLIASKDVKFKMPPKKYLAKNKKLVAHF